MTSERIRSRIAPIVGLGMSALFALSPFLFSFGGPTYALALFSSLIIGFAGIRLIFQPCPLTSSFLIGLGIVLLTTSFVPTPEQTMMFEILKSLSGSTIIVVGFWTLAQSGNLAAIRRGRKKLVFNVGQFLSREKARVTGTPSS